MEDSLWVRHMPDAGNTEVFTGRKMRHCLLACPAAHWMCGVSRLCGFIFATLLGATHAGCVLAPEPRDLQPSHFCCLPLFFLPVWPSPFPEAFAQVPSLQRSLCWPSILYWLSLVISLYGKYLFDLRSQKYKLHYNLVYLADYYIHTQHLANI